MQHFLLPGEMQISYEIHLKYRKFNYFYPLKYLRKSICK